ncbi:MAG: CoA transferase [Deltaproteobacteria bacterium]|nr:CoA transferase [Deltaproteobacteria bacterium]
MPSDTARSGAARPLGHLRVLELTVNMPGPFCATVLADLGARVTKVEPPGGDPLRFAPGAFASVNRGKRSIVLDLKVAAAQDLARRLAAGSDIVLEGWRPGVAARLGVDYATLAQHNPALVYCSIPGSALRARGAAGQRTTSITWRWRVTWGCRRWSRAGRGRRRC